nr:MAG TPA: hypothetical protein [Caudoviricetes sp.]
MIAKLSRPFSSFFSLYGQQDSRQTCTMPRNHRGTTPNPGKPGPALR